MAVTIEYTGVADFPWRVSSDCRTKAEAFAKGARVEEVSADAFIPAEVIAVAAGEPATGGGESSQVGIHLAQAAHDAAEAPNTLNTGDTVGPGEG